MITDKILNEDALHGIAKLPDDSVDCVVTSPPYYGLRNYDCDNVKWDNWEGQLGQEPSYKLYLDHLISIGEELKRVLKPTGTLFWNMGDSYAGNMGKRSGWQDHKYSATREEGIKNGTSIFLQADYGDIQSKSLMMIPERFALKMIDIGFILRNKIIWYKRNGMPTSVKDRFGNKWEYIYFFTKSKKYYFDLDSIRKPLSQDSIKRISQKKVSVNLQKFEGEGAYKLKHSGYKNTDGSNRINENGANPGDVIKVAAVRHKSWYSYRTPNYPHTRIYDPDADGGDFHDVPTRPHSFAHFAVYPESLIEPLIKAGCPREVCSKCGKPKMPFREKTGRTYDSRSGEYRDEEKFTSRKVAETNNVSYSSVFRTDLIKETKTVWKPSCSCNVSFVPGTVLDPFMGSGTTAIVTKKLGRKYVGFEQSKSYIDIAEKRIKEMLL